MKKLNKLLLLLVLSVALLFTGCSEIIDELESYAESEAEGGVIVEEYEVDEFGNPITPTVEDIEATEVEETSQEQTEDTTTAVTIGTVATEPEDTAVATETTEATEEITEATVVTSEEVAAISYEGSYTTAEDVALFIYTYNELPSNFITKNEARALGWEGGSLERYAPGMCIGGDRFGNYEGVLPAGNYTECDIDTLGANSRGAKRLVFSDDGRIYYTEDHYETFVLLYGEE